MFKERSELAKRLGNDTDAKLELGADLFRQAAGAAGHEIVELQTLDAPVDMPRVQTLFYGYAMKSK